MSTQYCLSSDGMVSAPLRQFRAHEPVYRHIAGKLDSTYQYFTDADRDEKKRLLNMSVTDSLLSVQNDAHRAERGYLRTLEAEEPAEVARAVQNLNYWKNKARYVMHNSTRADYDRIVDAYEDGDMTAMLDATVEECLGVQYAKASYALARVVSGDFACIDTHVAQQSGIDKERLDSPTADEYEAMWGEIEDRFDTLFEEAPTRFVGQWAMFDANRGEVATHDGWFLSLPEEAVDTI